MATAAEGCVVQVSVLGHFHLRRSGKAVELPTGAARLVALLAISEQPVARSRAAGLLWPDSSTMAAKTDLRSAIHQVRRGCAGVIDFSDGAVSLRPDIGVDLHEAERVSVALSTGAWSGDPVYALHLLCNDVLQDWTDEWVGEAQRQHRVYRSRALGWLSEMLSRAGRHGAAVDAAMHAIEADPLQESAWLALVRAHASEGNLSQALSEVDRFRELLIREIGAGVPACLLREVASLTGHRQVRRGQTSHQVSRSELPEAAAAVPWTAAGLPSTAPVSRR